LHRWCCRRVSNIVPDPFGRVCDHGRPPKPWVRIPPLTARVYKYVGDLCLILPRTAATQEELHVPTLKPWRNFPGTKEEYANYANCVREKKYCGKGLDAQPRHPAKD